MLRSIGIFVHRNRSRFTLVAVIVVNILRSILRLIKKERKKKINKRTNPKAIKITVEHILERIDIPLALPQQLSLLRRLFRENHLICASKRY